MQESKIEKEKKNKRNFIHNNFNLNQQFTQMLLSN